MIEAIETTRRSRSLLWGRVFVAAPFALSLALGACDGGDKPAKPAVAPAARTRGGFVESGESCGVKFQMAFLPGEQGETFKINLYDHGCATCIVDYDGDGDDDLFLVNQLGSNALYRNDGVTEGNPHFTNVTETSGLGLGDAICVAACFADLDNDGDQDVYITTTRAGNRLFRNMGGDRFEDVTDAAGVAFVAHSEQPCFLDIDGDGDLDLYVTNTANWTTDTLNVAGKYFEGPSDLFSLAASPIEHDRLFRNDTGKDGAWHFTDVTAGSGLEGNGWSGDVSALDYDDDGDLDLIVANMFGLSTLYRNDHGHFKDVTAETLSKTSFGAVGTKVFDYDGDGRLDIYLVDMHSDMWMGSGVTAKEIEPSVRYQGPEGPAVERGKMSLSERDDLRAVLVRAPMDRLIFGSTLFRNLGGGKFEETGIRANCETYWPWGAAAADFNSDGDQDLYIPSGMGYPFLYWPSAYLANDGTGIFSDVAAEVGLEPLPGGPHLPNKIAGKQAAKSARTAAVGDFDQDGRPDLVVNNFNDRAYLWMNRFAPQNWIELRLVGSPARDAIGAVATIKSGGRTLVRDVQSCGGYLAQSSRTLHFGLASEAGPVTVSIRWPSGETQTVSGLEPGKIHTVKQAAK